MIVATAGHVDHGKTSLVKALTGVDTDRLPEEKARGMSIDLGFAYLREAGRAPIAFVDVPGHARFVRNMIAGVHTIDLALLVVAADDGPMPQTLEHLRILELLGAPRAAVALTKIDRVDDAHRARSCHAVEDLLGGSRLAGAAVFPLSSTTGEGVAALSAYLHEAAPTGLARDSTGVFRMDVDRVFVLKGLGVVATGAVASGRIAVGDEVFVPSSGRRARVRSMHADNTEAPAAVAGQRCALNLVGPNREQLQRGDVLLGIDGMAASGKLDIELLGTARELRRRQSVRVYLGTQTASGVLEPPVKGVDASGESGNGSDEPRLARLSLSTPIVAFHGDRLLLRDAGRELLLGGGRVLDAVPSERGRRVPAQVREARLQVLVACRPDAAMVGALLALPTGVLDLVWLQRNLCVSPATIEQWLAEAGGVRLEGAHGLATLPGTLAAVTAEILCMVDDAHRDFPERRGIEARVVFDALRVKLRAESRDSQPLVLQAALHAAIAGGKLARSGAVLRRPDNSPVLSAEDTSAWQAIVPLLLREDLKPLHLQQLAQHLAKPPAEIERVLSNAADAGLAYRVAPNRYFLPPTIACLAAIAAELAAADELGSFDVAHYRDATALGRNLTIEVLEFLDSAGITRRRGARRSVVGSPEGLLA